MRCFIGVRSQVTPELDRVIERLGRMGPAVRAEMRENLHVTLNFLGDVEADQINSIVGVLEQSAGIQRAGDGELAGLGAFPSAARPSVLWAGVRGYPAVIAVQAELARGLAAIGFAPDARPFTPHLTLARVKFKPPPELRELLDAEAATAFGTLSIGQIELMESRSEGGRTRYATLATAALQRP